MSEPSTTSPTSESTTAAAPKQPPHRYTARLANAIEPRWQTHWEECGTFRVPNPGEPGFDPDRPKFFCLDMFPYPSGAGLHVGHPEGYTATDIVCRYQRHRGFNVLHPMGFDAFGLPAEQYAIQTGVHPAVTTKSAIENFRRQLKRFGFFYDWSREVATIDEDYYRWTQWIWLKAYQSWFDHDADKARPIDELIAEFDSGGRPVRFNPDAAEADAWRDQADTVFTWAEVDEAVRRRIIDSYRLAYLAEQTVNWCPKLGTALANEEVIDGRSERGGYPVFRKPLRQWMFRITAYADRLRRDLDDVDWPESTRTQQREWIGRSEGAEIDFPLADDRGSIRVYTTRPDTIFGATYMVLAPEHPLVNSLLAKSAYADRATAIRAYVEAALHRADVDRMAESKEKTGVFTGAYAVNPANRQRIPIWIADYVLMGYGHGAIMAVPGQDQRDWDFAKAFDLPIVRTVQPTDGFDGEAFLGDGPAINSGFLDGLDISAAKKRIIGWLEAERLGRRRVNFRLHNWLFSRQRYWGEPFPIVFDEAGHHYPVSDDHLPVRLPEMTDYHPVESDDPLPLLGKVGDWVTTTAGEAGVDPALLAPDTPVRRETNTMPGWAGSCWYYLRYCDPRNNDRFVGAEAERYWMSPDGVDLYIGGSEHAVLHLLYARFWHKILFDLGEVSTPEPFARLFHQGMITSWAYQRADRSLVPVTDVTDRGEDQFVETATGEPVVQVVAKMSKSLKNVINPDDVIQEYGADTFRLYEMYMGPLEATKPWNPQDIVGVYRFLQRAWRLVIDEETGAMNVRETADENIERHLHRVIEKVGHDIERLAFNTAIAALIEFVNDAHKSGGVTDDQLARFIVLLSPFAPHYAAELWHRRGGAGEIMDIAWPEYDPAMLREETVELPVQIMGKVRGRIMVAADADAGAVEAAALADEQIAALLEGKTVRKVIVVPGQIVNIVAN